MATAQDICLRAMKTCGAIGAGETSTLNDLQDVLDVLNEVIGEWSARRWLVFRLADVACTGNGKPSYTVGAGGDFNTPRPDRIEDAYARLLGGQTTPIDFPLEVMQAREDWDRVALKTLSSFPSSVFYDPGYPTGTLYVWPNPTQAYEIHIVVKAQLAQYALTDTVTLPDPYINAMRWTLASRIASIFAMQQRPDIVALMKTSLNTLRLMNARVPTMRMPAGLVRPGMGGAGGPWWAGVAGPNEQAYPVLDDNGQPVNDSGDQQVFSTSSGL